MNLLQDLISGASRAYDQINPFDNGLSWQTRQVNPSVQPASVAQQVYRNPIVQGAVDTAQKDVNTIGAGAAGVAALPNIGIQRLFGTPQSYQNAVQGANNTVNNLLTNGWGNKGGYLTPQQAASRGGGMQSLTKNFINPVAQGVAGNAPYVLPTGGIGEGANLAARAAIQAGTNAAVAGGSTALQEATGPGQFKTGDVLKSALMSGLIGGAAPLAGAAARAGVRTLPGALDTAAGKLNKLSADPANPESGHIALPGNEAEPAAVPEGEKGASSVGEVLQNKQLPSTPAANDSALTPKINRTQLRGNALDMPNRDIQDAMNSEAFANVFGVSHAEARANLQDMIERERAAKNRSIPDRQPAPKRAQAENTALNPMSGKLQPFETVEQGDYQGARVNGQRAESGVMNRAKQAISSIKRTGLNSSDFAGLVEGTRRPVNAVEREAVARYQDLTNYIHSTSQALGGNTNYVAQYFRHKWDLSNPEDAAKFEELANKGAYSIDPYNFNGLNNQPRIFNTVAEGERAGFKLVNQNPVDEVMQYAKGSANALKQQALSKGILEADMNTGGVHNRTFDFGNGTKIEGLTPQAVKELRAYNVSNKAPLPLQAYRFANRNMKRTLLSISEFHPINIAVLKAGPSLLFNGHPLGAAKGVFDTFRSQIGRAYSDNLMQSALHDELPVVGADGSKGTVNTMDAAAQLGTPIRHSSDFNTEGVQPLKPGLGERTIFDKAMPAMHIQMVRGLVKDLADRGIPLDSPEAREAGLAVNKVMGFINDEVENTSTAFRRASSDVLLARQFTQSKWQTLYNAFTKFGGGKGVGGNYARGAIAGNIAAEFALALGVGYLANQKSDNLRDLLIRTLIHPSIPTPWKDGKGNTIELSLPQNYISEAAGLVATIQRGQTGRLGASFNPKNIPQNLENYGRNRLATLPSTGLKIATNTDFGGKPMYDPNANPGVKVEQAATTAVNSNLPIGLQGVVGTDAVKRHLPGNVQNVLNAQAPGTNPLVKSVSSSFGFTPKTDQTIGKGQQTNQYFTALDKAKSGLNGQEQAVMTMVTGSKKNPVTGQYDIVPTPDDSRAKATALLQNPKVIDHLMSMNQQLNKQGQSVDPLWLQSKDHITAYYQYQAMPPGGVDRTNWMNQNGSWYTQLSNARNQYFATLPPGDPNRPQSPIQYPTATPEVQQLETQFFNASPKEQQAMIQAHPDLLQQFQASHDYTNQMRTAQGYTPLASAPTASQRVQSLLNQASATTDKKVRAQIYGDPEVATYMQAQNVYQLSKNAGLAQLQGNQLDQNALKAAYQIGNYDLVKNPNGQYALNNPLMGAGGSLLPSGAVPGAAAVGANAKSSYSSSMYGQNLGIPGMKHHLTPRPKKTLGDALKTAKKGTKMIGSAPVEAKAGVKRGKRLPVSSGKSGLTLSKRKVKV